ncbi:hypothetical protein HD597_006729 [Nonomuraea thailandensis]|uniref:Uncharacterized protein n=1 Tax=Nonomuraea thailandensis TaxID=1188745 RepID=A0A9X2K4R5_9ACTN|nr:hypothetical protein [Nonomuraea thailandensis]MCP2359709.1 hypothetical protein [Nonomuraea thailandensis]
MTTPDVAQLTRWWPLVNRPRPPYSPLTERIAEVGSLARSTKHAAEPLLAAAQALNTAALIASDCDLPDLAQELCWRQIAPYHRVGHLTIRQARHMLEPAINLARLRLRAGDAATAWALLDTLHHAIATNTEAIIEGRTLPTRDLTGSPEEYQELRVWAYRVYLSEGARALVRLGRWRDALAHIERNKGIGLHLMDGRQVKIVATCLAGDTETALAVLNNSTLTEPWEEQVAACLTVMCHLAGNRPAEHEADLMIGRYLASRSAPGHAVFQARLGLAVVDLTSLAAVGKIGPAYARLINDALTSADGYVAREILAHDRCRAMLIGAEKQALTSAVQAAGLGLGTIPVPVLADLLAAVEMSEIAIERSLGLPTGAHRLRSDSIPQQAPPTFSTVNSGVPE